MGCTPQAYEACAGPALRSKKEPGVSDRDINGLMDIGDLTSLKPGPGVTPHHMHQMVGRAWRQSSQGWGGGREITNYRGNWCQVGSLVTRIIGVGGACPFEKLS